MGKSNKKAKSDRINALRKQYDIFLEEDKKRKERNDFILGRLDKMRYNTALVPVRHKPSAYEARPAVVDRLGFQPEFSSVRGFPSCITNKGQLFPDIQGANNEDTFLLQEISKKYILIPKLRTTIMNNYVANDTINQNPERLQEMHLDQDTVPIKDLKTNTDDGTDWKSKYEILNILKNEEKGKPTENYQTGFDVEQDVPKESSLRNNQDEVAIDCDSYVNTNLRVEKPKEYVNEFPEKDLAADTLHYDLPKDSECSSNSKVYAKVNLVATENDTSSESNIIFANADQAVAIGDQLQNITLENKLSDAPNISIPPEEANYYEPQPEPDVNMTSMITDVGLKQSVHEENENVQDEYSVEPGSLIHDQNISIEQHEPAESEQVVYANNNEINPIQDLNYDSQPAPPDVNDHIFETENLAQSSNGQEFAPNIGVEMKADANVNPEDQIYLDSNIDKVQGNFAYDETENPVDITESINDFDTEQREMFYTQQADENYLNQQGDVDPSQSSKNDYPQNQEYNYYENTEPEAYPVELNDEEVTQAYDPHYEQQYADFDQESEQQQHVEQYQEPENGTDQADPEFTMLQYEQQLENQQKVEETLDAEDGYTSEMPPNVEPIGKSDNKTIPVEASNRIAS